jgi:hypothetical protein
MRADEDVGQYPNPLASLFAIRAPHASGSLEASGRIPFSFGTRMSSRIFVSIAVIIGLARH